MSYFTRQSLLLAPAQKWEEEQHPRVPAGEPGGGQFTAGGGGGGAPRITHHPVSFGSEGYGVEVVEDTGGKSQRARGARPERFQTMEEARSHAAILDKAPLPARAVPENPVRSRVDEKPITDLGFEGPRPEMIDTITDMRRRGMHVPTPSEVAAIEARDANISRQHREEAMADVDRRRQERRRRGL